MSKRIKGKTLIAKDEGDDAYGVVIKVYGEETNGAVGIIEQTFEPGFLLPPHVHENDVRLYILEGEMHVRVSDEVVKATPGCWVLANPTSKVEAVAAASRVAGEMAAHF